MCTEFEVQDKFGTGQQSISYRVSCIVYRVSCFVYRVSYRITHSIY